MLRRQLIFGISSGLLVSQGVRAKTVSDLVVPKERKLQLNAKPYYQLIEIKGTAFERGKRYGSSASGAIKRNIDFYSSAFEKSANIDWPQAQKLAMKFLPVIEKYCPSYVEEMKGIAEGAGRSFEDILTLNCRSEVLLPRQMLVPALLFRKDEARTVMSLWDKLGIGWQVPDKILWFLRSIKKVSLAFS